MYCFPVTIRVVREGDKLNAVARDAGVHIQTLYQWRQTPWWKEMEKQYIDTKQREFYLKMNRESDKVIDGYLSVMDGTVDPKLANAVVAGAKIYMESGDNAMIKKNPNMAVQINQTNNTVNHNVSIDLEKINSMSQDEVIEMVLTGNIPDKVKVVNE